MNAYEIIDKKKKSISLTNEEIKFMVEGYLNNIIPDYQFSAFLMAVYFRGMTDNELIALTRIMRDSGKILNHNYIKGKSVDKHSTGGVGDKTTLIVISIAASVGVKIPKMSGKSLGHTGGTLDKLESIPGFRINLSQKEIEDNLDKIGAVIIGQSEGLVPADKKIYSLRDTTATVDSIPLIASSIMSKKLASGASCLVLDVKLGSGAFMKYIKDARELARQMISIGNSEGIKTSAINVNKIKVTFNQEADTEAAKFEVKRGTVTEDVKVTWNDDKTEATLERTAGVFAPADYTVTVTGIEGLVDPVNTVTIEKEEIKAVSIENAQLQQMSKAPLTVKFVNQYGEEADIASTNVTITAFNKTNNTRPVTQVGSKYELNTSAANEKDEIQVTVVYKDLTATKTLAVVAEAAVGEVTLGEAVLPEGKTMFTPKDTKNVKLNYTAEDTYGDAYKLKQADLGSEVKLFSSDEDILAVADIKVVTDNKLEIVKFKKSGTVTITALAVATGKTSTTTITVNADTGVPTSVELEKTEVEFAAGSTDKQYVAITVKDNYGTVIPTKDLKSGDYAITSDNQDVVANSGLDLKLTGDNAGKIEITPKDVVKGKTATIAVLVTGSDEKVTFTVTASDKAVPSAIVVKKDTTVPSSLLVGAIKDLKFDVKDQYSNTITSAANHAVDFTTSDKEIIEIAKTNVTLTNPEVKVTAKKAGSATIKAQLKKDDVVIEEKSFTINVLANDSTKVTYSVAPIDKVYKAKVITDVSDNDKKQAAIKSGYAEEIKLTAKDENGNTVNVPASSIVSADLTQAKKNDDSGDTTTGQLAIFEYEGSYYVYTDTAFVAGDFNNTKGIAEDLKGKISFTINADDTVKLVSQDITVSKENSIAQSLKFMDKAPGTTGAAAKTEISINNLAGYTTQQDDVFAWVTDQFDATKAAQKSDLDSLNVFAIDGVTGANDDTITLTSAGKLTITNAGTATVFTKNNAKIRVVATKDGKTSFVTMVVKDGIEPVITSAAVTTQTTVDEFGAVGDVMTLTFSEDVVLNLTGPGKAMTAAEFKNLTGLTGTGGQFEAEVVNGNKVVIKVVTSAITTKIDSSVATTTKVDGEATVKLKDIAGNSQKVTSGVVLTQPEN